MLLLFSFITPRTAKLLSFVMAVYSVYITHGLFSVVMGIMSLVGGPYGGFSFTKMFFTVIFFSVLFGFIFDSIFRFFMFNFLEKAVLTSSSFSSKIFTLSLNFSSLSFFS